MPKSDDRKVPYRLAAGLSLTSFVLYALTLFPSIYGVDSAELVTVAYRLGVAHPPGYPLYTLLAKLFTFLPVGSIAWRVNLFSAVADSLAVFFLFLSAWELTGSRIAGIVSGGMFAFSPLVWRFAVVAEVFALNNLFLSLLVYLTVRYLKERDDRMVYAGALLSGLAASHHHTFALYAVPLTALLFWKERQKWVRTARLGKIGALFALGLLPYLYLPIAARHPDAVSWGLTDTFTGFFRHLLRLDYGTFQLTNAEPAARPFETFFQGLACYLGRLPGETLYVGWVLALVGLIVFARRPGGRPFALGSLALYLFYLIVFHLLSNMRLDTGFKEEVVARFWQQPNLLLFLWMGLGAAALLSANGRWMSVLSAVLCALVAAQGTLQFRRQDPGEANLYHQMAAAFLEGLPKNAVLLLAGDLPVNAVWYLQECEHVREDILVLNRSILGKAWTRRYVERARPDVVMPAGLVPTPKEGEPSNTKLFVDANRDRFTFFMNGTWESEVREERDSDYQVWPHGLTDQIVWIAKAADKAVQYRSSETALRALETTLPETLVERYAGTPWGDMVHQDYWNARGRLGYRLIRYSCEHGYEASWLREGAGLIESDLRHADLKSQLFRKTLGIAYTELTSRDPSYGRTAVLAWKDYLRLAPADDPDLGRISRFIEEHHVSLK